MGSQQLLLDVYNLKTLMLKVPSLGTCPSLRFPRLLIHIYIFFIFATRRFISAAKPSVNRQRY